jgi:hypothetical protein
MGYSKVVKAVRFYGIFTAGGVLFGYAVMSSLLSAV